MMSHAKISVLGSVICFLAAFFVCLPLLLGDKLPENKLLILAIPLVSTGIVQLISLWITAFSPQRHFKFPLNFTFPLVWCFVALTVGSISSTLDTGIMRMPEEMAPIRVWASLPTYFPVFLLQCITLTMIASANRSKS